MRPIPLVKGRTRLWAAALAGALAVAATACGGSGSGGDGGGDGSGDVIVGLEDFSLTATPGSFAAGPISFGIENDGPSVHELAIVRSDDVPDALPVDDGLIPEDQIDLVDEVEDIAPGASASLDVTLDAGAYVLVCNLPAHYEQGMFAAFTVE